MNTRKGFSLVEMLVVFSIAAFLVALLTGLGAKVVRSGKEAQSISQLRQIAAAFHAYANDNNDRLPRGYSYQPGQTEVTYVTEVMPYLDEPPSPLQPKRNIFISPTSALPVPPKAAGAFIPMTYSVHGLLCPDTSNGKPQFPRSAIIRPSQVILIGDSAQNPTSRNSFCTFKTPTAFAQSGSDKSLNEAIPVGPDSDSPAGLGHLRYRSNGSAVVAMADGHVVAMRKGSVTYGNIIADR